MLFVPFFIENLCKFDLIDNKRGAHPKWARDMNVCDVFCLIWFRLVWFGLVWSGLVWFGLICFDLVCIIQSDWQSINNALSNVCSSLKTFEYVVGCRVMYHILTELCILNEFIWNLICFERIVNPASMDELAQLQTRNSLSEKMAQIQTKSARHANPKRLISATEIIYEAVISRYDRISAFMTVILLSFRLFWSSFCVVLFRLIFIWFSHSQPVRAVAWFEW